MRPTFRFRVSLVAAASFVLPHGWLRAEHPACPPLAPRVVVNNPAPTVVVIDGDGDGKGRCLRLFNHPKKKKERATETVVEREFFVPIPAMVTVPPCRNTAPNTEQKCAEQKCAEQKCPDQKRTDAGSSPDNSLATATQDLKASIERLKALKVQREVELASLNSLLAPTPAPTPQTPTVTVTRVTPDTNAIRDLNDKIDYLSALIDALAADLQKSNPSLQLPAFDDLNRLRKPKP